MKKILTFLLVVLPFITVAQVRVASAAAPKAEKITFHYDSTKNSMNYADYYIGQDLFAIPAYNLKFKASHVLFGRSVETQYRSTSLKDEVSHYDIAGHTFHVQGKVNYSLYGQNPGNFAYLELVDEMTGDTIYFEFNDVTRDAFPFIVLGFKEKFERDNKEKKFVYKNYSLDNFETGETIDAHGTTWTFKEIIAVPGELEPYYYLVNSTGAGVAVADMKDFIPKSIINNYTKKYGKSMVDTALDGRIKVGMPEVLVKLAWGEPDHINRASYGDQWVYGYINTQCVYFKNGKVTDWN